MRSYCVAVVVAAGLSFAGGAITGVDVDMLAVLDAVGAALSFAAAFTITVRDAVPVRSLGLLAAGSVLDAWRRTLLLAGGAMLTVREEVAERVQRRGP